MSKYLLSTFFYFFIIFDSFSKLTILEWNQTNRFNIDGQEVEVSLIIKAEDIPDKFYYNKWIYVFSSNSNVRVLEAKSLSPVKYRSLFSDNKLTIEFDKLSNNKTINLYFKYQLNNNENNNYMKREWVQIPKFVSGAKFSLNVHSMKNMDIYSLNEEFIYNYNNIYTLNGIVPSNGIISLFEMTPKEANWLVSTNIEIDNSVDTLDGLELKIPLNFMGGNNSLVSYNVSSSQGNSNGFIDKEADNIFFKFKNYKHNNGFIRIDANIKNNNFYWNNNFDNSELLSVNNDYVSEYNTLIGKILLEDTSKSAVHVKIAKWVNKNIEYDKNFINRIIDSKEILFLKKGVCRHYAILYQDLLRSIGIPAKAVVGMSYSIEKMGFEDHSWVMVNYNGQWIPIDPTWGIYSGKLPVSHIFVHNDIDNKIIYLTSKDISSINLNIKNSAISLDY